MSGSDAIIVGESWISEHYFGSEATSESFHAEVLARRKAWDAEEKAERPSPRSRFTAVRQKLEVELAALAELADPDGAVVGDAETIAKAAHEVYREIITVLELRGHGLQVTETGPLLRVSAAGITERAPLAVILAQPAGTHEDALAKDADTLLQPLALEDDGPEFTSAARLVSALFVDESAAPDLALILAGRWIVLAEQERWAEGRFLAVDLQLICERNETKRGGEIDRALTCLSAESVAPDAAGRLWWLDTLEKSVKHTVGVSKDLREGVRLSIEIIANEVVARRHAQGLDPLPGAEANELAKQSLRFLYRILFLLYAEASPELGVLPAGAAEYDAGYSLDRLRELVQVELASPRSIAGTHLYDSLSVLFRLVDMGHTPERVVEASDEDDESGAATSSEGLSFNALRADLFHPRATRFIDAVRLGNAALQKVLAHLLLSKERTGKDRGFISYAELGINQLGAVYEGLMSYTGFFAESDLYEVAKGGDSSKGSWVVPVSRSEGIAASDFVKAEDPRTGEKKPVLHRAGSFVFRLAGRERQQSASYYTPEVLTRFTVGQALEELLDQDGRRTSAEEILELTVCEPALGSGAFALEAVRQLADQYLKRRQDELGERIDPDDYPRRLQEVKAYLALHNVYGVDLNATAVELAEISLWLDTMVSGLSAPWFGLHLKRGNSLIGARRAVYRRSQVADKSWLGAVPVDLPLTSLPGDIAADRVGSDLGDGIHHFLLPADGWGAAADAKEAAALVPDAVKKLKSWRGATKTKLSKAQVTALAELANRVEALWQISYRRLHLAEQEIRRSIPVWGAGELPAGGAVQREQIEESLADEAGAYQRLRRVMDAWAAMWFWPLNETAITVDGHRVEPPTLDQWIGGLQALLGRNPGFGGTTKKKSKRDPGPGQISLGEATSWDELGRAEQLELDFAGARSIDTVLAEHPWLVVCERLAQQQGFFHWHVDFATVFARGGFDLQLGNPPWVQPEFSLPEAVGEVDASLVLTIGTGAAQRAKLLASLNSAKQIFVSDVASSTSAIVKFLKALPNYPMIGAAAADLYKSFLESSWSHRSALGIVALVHSSSMYQEERAGLLRSQSYPRLRRFWQFTNERKMFDEIGNRVSFAVTVHAECRTQVAFLNASQLLEPATVEKSLLHDGSGPVPRAKNDDGKWDTRPHRRRIRRITNVDLSAWTLEASDQKPTTPFMFSAGDQVDNLLRTLSALPTIKNELTFHHWGGVGETSGVEDGLIVDKWARVRDTRHTILQGPHLSVCNPTFQGRGVERRSHRDWTSIDLRRLSAEPVWETGYQVADAELLAAQVPMWDEVPADSLFRVAWRRRVGAAGIRSLQPAILPPGVRHIETIVSVGSPSWRPGTIALLCGVLSSVVTDFQVRVAQKSDIRAGLFQRLRFTSISPTDRAIELRVLRLNCVNSAYADLWNSWNSHNVMKFDGWSCVPPTDLPHNEREIAPRAAWDASIPLRTDWSRRQALIEIDALTALRFGLTAEDLCDIFRAQFGVMRQEDAARALGHSGRFVNSTSTLPPLDWERDAIGAHQHFVGILADARDD